MKITKTLTIFAAAAQAAACLAIIPKQNAAIRAEAASGIEMIQTRVLQYDFGVCSALYDTRTQKWYTPDGTEIKSKTAAVQDQQYGEDWVGERIRVNFETGKSAYVTKDADGNEELTDNDVPHFTDLLSVLSYWYPPYAETYYDKAQQKELPVPKPQALPLTYVMPLHADAFCCDIYLGMSMLGRIQYAGSGDVALEFTDAETLTAAAVTSYTDAGDSDTNGRINIADAVLTAQASAEVPGTVISELGFELADTNEDGMVGVQDVCGVLNTLVSPSGSAGDDTPAGIPVLSHVIDKGMYGQQGDTEFLGKYAETFLTGGAVGYADGYLFNSELTNLDSYVGDHKNAHYLRVCDYGSDCETWSIAFLFGDLRVSQAEIVSMVQTNDVLHMTVAALEDQNGSNFILHQLKLPLGYHYSKIKRFDVQFEFMSDSTAMEEYMDTVPEELSLRTGSAQEPVIPEGAVPVISSKQSRFCEWDLPGSDEDEYILAAYGLDPADPDAFLKITGPAYLLTEGDEIDTLRIYIPDDEGFSTRILLQSLDFSGGVMQLGEGMMHLRIGQSPESDESYWVLNCMTLTVPHGSLPEITGIETETNTYLDLFEEYTALHGFNWDQMYADARTPLYISVTE